MTLLQQYLGRMPDDLELARFYLACQVITVQAALYFLKNKKVALETNAMKQLVESGWLTPLKRYPKSLNTEEMAHWIFDSFLTKTKSDEFAQAMNLLNKDGRSTGLEPATFGSTIQRSNQLSYDRHR
jgi:hypothetical protein